MKLFSSLNMRGNRILDCPDTEINGQKPTYTEAAKLENISSGETVKVAFGKLRKAVDVLMAHYVQKATASILGHVKLSNSAAITTAGEYALDAIEKNASVNGTLANQIGTINGSLTNINAKLCRMFGTVWGTSLKIPSPTPHGFILVNHVYIYAIWTAGNTGSFNSNIFTVCGDINILTVSTNAQNGEVDISIPFTGGITYIGR